MKASEKNVVVIMTDDDKGLWSIYEESGQAVEHDFKSEYLAVQYATNNDMNVVDYFNF